MNNHRNDQSFIEGSSIRGEDGKNPEWYALRESGCHRRSENQRIEIIKEFGSLRVAVELGSPRSSRVSVETCSSLALR